MIYRISIPGERQDIVELWNSYTRTLGSYPITVHPGDVLNLTLTIGELSVTGRHAEMTRLTNELIDSDVDFTVDYPSILQTWVVMRHMLCLSRQLTRKQYASSRVSKPYLPSPVPQESGTVLRPLPVRDEDAQGMPNGPNGSRVEL
jgi:hypothetical protein